MYCIVRVHVHVTCRRTYMYMKWDHVYFLHACSCTQSNSNQFESFPCIQAYMHGHDFAFSTSNFLQQRTPATLTSVTIFTSMSRCQRLPSALKENLQETTIKPNKRHGQSWQHRVATRTALHLFDRATVETRHTHATNFEINLDEITGRRHGWTIGSVLVQSETRRNEDRWQFVMKRRSRVASNL